MNTDPGGEAEKDGLSGVSSLLQPLANKSVVDRIIDRLTRAILDRELKPGQKIPTEVELCESMQVGRNSVREAIKVLVTMGVLVIRRSEGTFVTEGFSERMLDPMVYGLILEGGDSLDLIELRRVFDTGVFRCAIEKRTDADLAELRASYDAMEETIRGGATEQSLLSADMRFHRVVGHMARNPLVDKVNVVIERLTVPSRLLAIRQFMERGEQERFLERHADMLRVIAERDLGAVDEVLSEHFLYWRSASVDGGVGRG